MAGKPVALVTGAGRGMGAASARELHSRGYDLVLNSPTENCEALARELGGHAVRGSLAEAADVKRMVDAAVARFGALDAIVMSNGHAPWSSESTTAYDPDFKGPLLEIPDEDWVAGFNLMLMSTIRLLRLATPHMEARGGGSVVLISSFACFEPRLVFPVSSVYRPAIAGFAKLYADRYAPKGIRINAVLPGFMENWPMNETVERSIPMARSGRMEEVAKAVGFLVSADASYITGQSLLIDGGVTRAI